MNTISRKQQTQKRHRRLRRFLVGTKTKPRLSVFRSNNHIYAQVIDDQAQSTICSASTIDKEFTIKDDESTSNCDSSSKVGSLLAKRAIKKGVKEVVFDRGGNIYHGRVVGALCFWFGRWRAGFGRRPGAGVGGRAARRRSRGPPGRRGLRLFEERRAARRECGAGQRSEWSRRRRGGLLVVGLRRHAARGPGRF